MENEDPKNSSEYRVIRILQSEAARYAAILVFFAPMAYFVYSIKLDIALIKQNHLTHIEAIEEELKEDKEEIIELKKQDIEIQKQALIILEKLTK